MWFHFTLAKAISSSINPADLYNQMASYIESLSWSNVNIYATHKYSETITETINWKLKMSLLIHE